MVKEYKVYTNHSNTLTPSQPESGWFRSRAQAEQCMAQLTAKGYTTHIMTRTVEDDSEEGQ